MVGESGSRRAVPGPGGVVACVECQSLHVRPSGSSYPMDPERNFEGKASFWRCSNCGARFMGPLVPESKRHHHRRSSSGDRLAESVTLSRVFKRWAFPLIVILVTAIAVAFVLDRRNQDTRPRIVVTPPR